MQGVGAVDPYTEQWELRPRSLPFTSKYALPKWEWLVSLYLRLRPVQWLVGRQTFVAAVKPARPAG